MPPRDRHAGLSPALRLALLAAALLLFPLAPSADARWRPQPTTAPWQWQLQGRIDTSIAAPVYEVDGFDVGRTIVQKLHRQGRKAICYIDVGSWESYRPDARRFPDSVKGKRYEGYPDERWLDIRRIGVLAPILSRPLSTLRPKGLRRGRAGQRRMATPTTPASRYPPATSSGSTAGSQQRSTGAGCRWR